MILKVTSGPVGANTKTLSSANADVSDPHTSRDWMRIFIPTYISSYVVLEVKVAAVYTVSVRLHAIEMTDVAGLNEYGASKARRLFPVVTISSLTIALDGLIT
jgi:hypothetical protein